MYCSSDSTQLSTIIWDSSEIENFDFSEKNGCGSANFSISMVLIGLKVKVVMPTTRSIKNAR
jgi:hypothetical protein